ncbi:uncharacterized protein ARMOST_14875 [Armillaria ostoyae]|uniref:Uncharacterized protein n=1 Tax=Armillaria ostoyae TaxID=47428 RepID=A0A284RRT9_ARMOS|nr:uncharacterized protein ARMOST_14875 [Armillaria ostoyae]
MRSVCRIWWELMSCPFVIELSVAPSQRRRRTLNIQFTDNHLAEKRYSEDVSTS